VVKKNIILIILMLLGAFLFVALQKHTKEFYSSSEEPRLSITDFPTVRYFAPNFTLSDLNGNAAQLSDYRGSVVLILFWTTW
jgi:cytochrome oxidase Cu insertion factor (SCO1/SenC/PrrC family)